MESEIDALNAKLIEDKYEEREAMKGEETPQAKRRNSLAFLHSSKFKRDLEAQHSLVQQQRATIMQQQQRLHALASEPADDSLEAARQLLVEREIELTQVTAAEPTTPTHPCALQAKLTLNELRSANLGDGGKVVLLLTSKYRVKTHRRCQTEASLMLALEEQRGDVAKLRSELRLVTAREVSAFFSFAMFLSSRRRPRAPAPWAASRCGRRRPSSD
jgi:hypothetical protein